MDQEISELLEKGAIREAEKVQEEFLSNIFLVGKEDGGKPSGDKSEKTQCIHPS